MDMHAVGFLLMRKEAIRSLTLDVAKAMPEENWDYKPYDESYTFTQLLLHAVTFETRVCQRITTGVFGTVNYATEPTPLKEAIALADELTAKNLETLRNVPPDQWEEIIELPWGLKVPLFALVNATNEHEVHHRGQMYVHLRLKGITPPRYR